MVNTTLRPPEAPSPYTRAQDLARLAETVQEIGDSNRVRVCDEAIGPAEFTGQYTVVYTRIGFVHIHKGSRRIASTLLVDEAVAYLARLAAQTKRN